VGFDVGDFQRKCSVRARRTWSRVAIFFLNRVSLP
jgi:hypothetical protein